MPTKTILAAAAAAVVLLAGCAAPQVTPAPVAARATLTPAPSLTPAVQTCTEQAGLWKWGPGGQALNQLRRALAPYATTQQPGQTQDERLAAAVQAARSQPIPRCADPAGYYARFLTALAATAAAESAHRPGPAALADLDRALVAARRLRAEVRHTVGLSLNRL